MGHRLKKKKINLFAVRFTERKNCGILKPQRKGRWNEKLEREWDR